MNGARQSDHDGGVPAEALPRQIGADIQSGLQQGVAEAGQEVVVDAAGDASAALDVGGRRGEGDRDPVRSDETGPLDEGAPLARRHVGLVLAEQPRAAWDEDAAAVEPSHVTRHDGSGVAGSRGVQSRLKHRLD